MGKRDQVGGDMRKYRRQGVGLETENVWLLLIIVTRRFWFEIIVNYNSDL